MARTVSRARDTLELKQEAVCLVEGGPGIATAARTLGVVDQTLFNLRSAVEPARWAAASTLARV
jgi:transposase